MWNPLHTTPIPIKLKKGFALRAITRILSSFDLNLYTINEPVHEISNNVVCASNKASDQPARMRIRAVWSEPLLVAWVFYDC